MVLGLTRMNRILEIDEENLTATAEAGVITVDLFNAAAARGLFYPPDPGSQNVSTLGGNVAENAGGLRGLKYGVTRNYVMALSGLLYDGTEFIAGNKCVKDVAGYSLRDLLVGSEGTLGIITEVTVRLINPPQDKRTLLAYFRDIRTAGEAVSRIIAARIIPATLEIMDKTTINCVEDYAGIGLPREMGALLLIEVDGHPAVVAEEAEGVRKILEEVRADVIRQAANAEEAAQLTAARRTALSAVARVSPTTILEDATVPRSRLAETFAEIERLKEKYGIRVATFGHAGDGNLHPTAVTDERNRRRLPRSTPSSPNSTKRCFPWEAPSPANTGSASPRRATSCVSSARGGWASCAGSRTPSIRTAASIPERSSSMRPFPQDVRRCREAPMTETIPHGSISIRRTPRVTNPSSSACAAASVSRSAPPTP